MKFLTFFIGFLLYTHSVKSQRILSSNEIFDFYLKEMQVLNLNKEEGLKRFLFSDSILNSKISNSLLVLKAKNVDTLGYFAISSPVKINTESLFHQSYTTTIHLIWQENGLCFVQEFSSKCDYGVKQLDSLKNVFSFYSQNFYKICAEYIMPVIFSGKIDLNGRFSYSGPTFFHERDFNIFLQVNNDVKFLNFTHSDVVDNSSIFYNYNVNSKSYWLFSLMNQLLDDIH
jgi:hypothetical protein